MPREIQVKFASENCCKIMPREIQVKFASENCCKITQFSANSKRNNPFIYRFLQ